LGEPWVTERGLEVYKTQITKRSEVEIFEGQGEKKKKRVGMKKRADPKSQEMGKGDK